LIIITIKNYLFLVTVHYSWNVQLDDGSILNIYGSWNIYNHCVWLYTFSIKGGDGGSANISPGIDTAGSGFSPEKGGKE